MQTEDLSTAQRETTVLFIWEPPDRLREYLENGLEGLPGIKLVYPPDVEEETLTRLAPDADIIIGWRPTKGILDAAERLKLFINPGAGVQHLIDLFREQAERRDITLVNGHGNSYFTAQHAVAMLLALTNKVIPHHNWMVQGQWRKGDKDAVTIPMRDRSVGLLGYGAVNSKVHRFLSGFEVEFHALRSDWSKLAEAPPTHLVQYTPDQLDDFLKAIDILIVALPMTPKTDGLIGAREFELLGPDGLFLNFGRGGVVDEKSLYNALKEKVIAGAALDVWYNYTPVADEGGRTAPYNYPFHELDNVVLSPHRAASPFRDLKRWDEVIENITRFANGRTDFLNVVDIEAGY
ncbi:MAG: hypothetical protein JW941_01560 [Candidatus Coatesbacteria bacterium]|nr:hypothetical protein [Candidatus Coatesbacteria bacterium]